MAAPDRASTPWRIRCDGAASTGRRLESKRRTCSTGSASASSRTASQRQLSGGEQQRVGLGRALARHAVLYLFDEPTAHLDAHLRDVFLGEIAARRRRRLRRRSMQPTTPPRPWGWRIASPCWSLAG